MTPEQWALLSPQQQAQHVAMYGPPPPGYSPDVPVTAKHAASTRTARKTWWLVGVAAVAALLVLSVSITSGGKPTPTADTARITATVPPTSATVSAADTTTAPTVAASTSAAPVITVNPGPPKTITARDWAKIAKDPDAHKGETIVVYGQVTQFDSATGTDSFRANVDGVKHKVSYGYADYDTNTVLTSAGANLGDVVNRDLFRAEVVVVGSLSYDTSLGGSTTVPQLAVTKIDAIGTAK